MTRGRRKLTEVRCSGYSGRTGDWVRCAATSKTGAVGWTSTTFGFYCPRHAALLGRAGRGA